MKWEFPGGKVEPSETAPQALRREILEELGICVEVGQCLGTFTTPMDTHLIELECYWCTSDERKVTLTSHDEAGWFSVDELYKLDWAQPDVPVLDLVIKEITRGKKLETLEYPCIKVIKHLLHSIPPSIENNQIALDKFIEFALTELELTKSIYWCYESVFFEELALKFETFYSDNLAFLKEQNKNVLSECVLILRFLATKKENLDDTPEKYIDLDEATTTLRADIDIRVLNRLNKLIIKCPSCNQDFSQFETNVARSIFSVKCPRCNQSIYI